MLKLYNTMSRGIEEFKPRKKGKADIFTCGPSIYRRPHIGNYRTFLYEDLLVRYLEYTGLDVSRVINLTDIEDKTISEAKALGKEVAELTEGIAEFFFWETKELSIKLSQIRPASKSVDQCVRIIQRLLRSGYAYWDKGDIFFDAMKFKSFGKLFRLDLSGWPKAKRLFRRDTYNGRRWNKGDFILWHGCANIGKPCWNTEIGPGRPSWNIQDPAVVTEAFGNGVDIACGGIDNIYRHHDYNIAVTEAFTGKEYARFHMHGEHLMVDGKTMSKSRGNILYPENLYKKGYKPHHLRFFLLYTHYRKKLNFTGTLFNDRSKYLDRVRMIVKDLLGGVSARRDSVHSDKISNLLERLETDFTRFMDEDLNFGKAFDGLTEQLEKIGALAGNAGLTAGEKKRLKDILSRIDSVGRVLT